MAIPDESGDGRVIALRTMMIHLDLREGGVAVQVSRSSQARHPSHGFTGMERRVMESVQEELPQSGMTILSSELRVAEMDLTHPHQVTPFSDTLRALLHPIHLASPLVHSHASNARYQTAKPPSIPLSPLRRNAPRLAILG